MLRSNWRTPFGEIDLFFKNENKNYFLIEVKTASNSKFQNYISKMQISRQKRVLQWLISQYEHVHWYLAVVDLSNRIRFIILENE